MTLNIFGAAVWQNLKNVLRRDRDLLSQKLTVLAETVNQFVNGSLTVNSATRKLLFLLCFPTVTRGKQVQTGRKTVAKDSG